MIRFERVTKRFGADDTAVCALGRISVPPARLLRRALCADQLEKRLTSTL